MNPLLLPPGASLTDGLLTTPLGPFRTAIRPPRAADDGASTTSAAPVVVRVLDNDEGPAGAALAVASVAPPSHGAASRNTDGTITYTPDPGYSGVDLFTYTVRATGDAEATARVTVTVNAGACTFAVQCGRGSRWGVWRGP